jgi:zinc protease
MTNFAERTKRYEFPNGLTLLVLENHASPQVSLAGYFRAGELFNPVGKDLLGDVTATMLNKGTQRHTKLEIAERIESVAMRLGFDTATFASSLGGRSLSKDLPLLVSTMAELLREPTFPADELDKLKKQYLASLKEYLDDTGSRAYERLTQLVFDESHPFHRYPTERTMREIESITTADVRGFYDEHYGADGMIVVAVGDVEPEAVRDLFGEHFGDWQGAKAKPIEVPFTSLQDAPQREIVFLKDKPNCNVVIGHASGLRRTSPDYYAAIIANRALGHSTLSSRLGMKVRDELGLTYGINSSFSETGFADGPFVINVTLAPHNIELAIETSLQIVSDYIASGISEQELTDEISSMVGSYKVGLATNAGIAGQLASVELFGLGVQFLDQYPDIVRAVTQDEVNAAIRKYLHPHKATTVIAGSYQA